MNNRKRLEELRAILRSESMSYDELHELQDLGARGLIDPGDVELLEAAGVPEQMEPGTPVVFRRYSEGDTIALFPTLNHSSGDANYGYCMSYQHVGQHGEANYPDCIASTGPATPEQYADLRRELEGIGYVLKIQTKRHHTQHLV